MARKPDYGRGPKAFLEYARFIVEHPNYKGMPDVYMDNGDIQWEAPSNRKSGKHKDTHHKRRAWWREKAVKVSIAPDSLHWISRTAKFIHPTKKKPCKNCGRVMDIRYAYPSATLLGRIKKLDFIDESFPVDPLEHITSLVTRLVEQFGDHAFESLPLLLKTSTVKTPVLPNELQRWLLWIEEKYMPQEPSTLSPGAMSNAPDRLEGFHSFNLCCRSKTDPGRSKENLQSYTTDRRVFEYWVEGDWVAADRLMGLVRSDKALKEESCVNGHPGPCAADHIGPISLGFVHRPEFQLLCRMCNSAKNNRMLVSDVRHLIAAEKRGEQVASWYCQALWNKRKDSVKDEETALRLSKLLRDNRHTLMRVLERIAAAGHYTFLATFLGLECAKYDVAFVNFRAMKHITRFDEMIHSERTTKYAGEQQARRLRVAFDALKDYFGKENRNAYVIMSSEIERLIRTSICSLDETGKDIQRLDKDLDAALSSEIASDEALREVATKVPSAKEEPTAFKSARAALRAAMDLVAVELSQLWDDERYVRAILGEDEAI
ncbi:MAG TPA: Alw26I/Eco31I/Esp3I family type II restriction endonuclease [Granulicella sp.]